MAADLKCFTKLCKGLRFPSVHPASAIRARSEDTMSKEEFAHRFLLPTVARA